MFNLGALASISTVLNSMDSAAKDTIEDINKTVTIITSTGTHFLMYMYLSAIFLTLNLEKILRLPNLSTYCERCSLYVYKTRKLASTMFIFYCIL